MDGFGHDALPNIHVLLSPWKPIQKISSGVVISFDCFLYQPNHEFAGHQFPFPNDSIDLLAQLRACFDLFAKQVSGGEVDESIFFDQDGALTT